MSQTNYETFSVMKTNEKFNVHSIVLSFEFQASGKTATRFGQHLYNNHSYSLQRQVALVEYCLHSLFHLVPFFYLLLPNPVKVSLGSFLSCSMGVGQEAQMVLGMEDTLRK